MTPRSRRACVLVTASSLVPVLAALFGSGGAAQAACPIGWEQLTPATAPGARYFHTMAYDSRRGVVVLFGGAFDTSTVLGDTWEWDGTNWTRRTPAISPSVRYATAMAYDSVRGVTVLFGGISNPTSPAPLNDTWEWNGSNWTQRTPAASPPGRAAHAMAFDSARGVVVLFGGVAMNGSPAVVADTWEWNGTNWTQRTPATAPPARQTHAMAYDSARGVTVLFGGSNVTGTSFGDTWEWNGTNWIQRTPASAPSARQAPAMAYGLQGKTVLVGGAVLGSGTPDTATWLWNGTTWTSSDDTPNPGPRLAAAVAYDSARGKVIFFGGNNGTGTSNDTWELSSMAPVFVQQPVTTTVVAGSDAVFGVTVESAERVTYQWRRNGINIVGANRACYRIPAAQTTDAGVYDVFVYYDTCMAMSTPARLKVRTCNGTITGDVCAGDGNCDGVISWRDIDYLIAGQNDNTTGWESLFPAPGPACDFWNLDTNGDEHVNWRDIDPFVGQMNKTCP